MREDNRSIILHIIKNIAQRGKINGDFKVREEDLNAIVRAVEKDMEVVNGEANRTRKEGKEMRVGD